MRTQMTDEEAFHALSLYTLAHSDSEFVHQYIVDAYAAQHATESSKPIYLDFALAGLYLHNEKGYTGKQVQNAHIELAKHKELLPHFSPIDPQGSITVHEVLAVAPGIGRDTAIREWSASVWKVFGQYRTRIESWLNTSLKFQ